MPLTCCLLPTGEHEHTIVGYSLIKGIGDGEPIASERFTVGGHEWVLLFYPDGKKSSAELHNINPQQVPPPHAHLAAAGRQPPANRDARPPAVAGRAAIEAPPPPPGAAAAPPPPPVGQHQIPVAPPPHMDAVLQQFVVQPAGGGGGGNDYCALFVALIGEGGQPQGVVNTSDGRVVRAFHRFTLVDQSGRNQDITKGRRRDQGAVKISCARQDPNARNCHGYRKFIKKSVLEDPARGLLVNDTIVIKYQIELVVSSGGALQRGGDRNRYTHPQIAVPPVSLGKDLGTLLEDSEGTDVQFDVDGEVMAAHKIILSARSPVFQAMLNGPMREGHAEMIEIADVRAPVFKALLHFAYTDDLPLDLRGSKLEVTMAQHLLAAADRFQLLRLRCLCEQRLCETVEVETVATTLALAEQNNANELKRVCLEFVSRHLQQVMASEGYQYMITTCPQLQSEILKVIAAAPPPGLKIKASHEMQALAGGGGGGGHQRDRMAGGEGGGEVRGGRHNDESSTDGQMRRVRARRE